MALDVGVKEVGRGGVLAIPQDAWEGLDPENRSIIDSHARSIGVVVLTAEAAEGDLRAEEMVREDQG